MPIKNFPRGAKLIDPPRKILEKRQLLSSVIRQAFLYTCEVYSGQRYICVLNSKTSFFAPVFIFAAINTMNKNGPPPPYDLPPTAPPSYAQCVGGVPPASPFTPAETYVNGPTIVTTVVPLGPGSTHTICPHCYAEIDTATRTEPGMIAYVSGFLIALLGCWAGCCLIPCCIDECMDVHHTCPNCKAYLGRHRR